MAAISIQGLTKQYGTLKALNDLNLEIAEGEILGFLGLNGAGKTTTIRILLDLLRPTAGRAAIFGHDCQAHGLAARSKIGYLPGEMGIYSDMTGWQVLDLLAGLSQQKLDPQRLRTLQDRLEFPDRDLSRKVREYSTGMKRKIGIMQAFQSDPQLLILDEPTEGLDPLMQESFYELVADSKRRGKTIFMSSHVLSEVERVCDRFALLRKGELVLLSTMEESRKLAARRVRVFFGADVIQPRTFPPGIEIIDTGARVWNLKVEGMLRPLLDFLAGFPVEDIQMDQAKLEDVVMKYYREGAA